MRTEMITVAGDGPPGRVNEDRTLVGDGWAAVLDGASQYPGVDIRCVHDVAWVVDHLSYHLAAGLTAGAASLPTVLADAIRATAAEHGPACDVTHPLALGATVAIAREHGEAVEWLVLGDAAAVVESAGRVDVITDDRLERLPDPPVTDAVVRTYEPSYVARWRNQPGGFWIASTVPEAADHALTGRRAAAQVRRVLLCTDGITRLVDRYGYEWADLLALADSHRGMRALVDAVRGAEQADPAPRRWRGKRHDDATAVLLRLHAGDPVPDRATRPEPQPVVAAVVTSDRGVLVGRRNDGRPPWTLIAGEIEPGESPADAAIREVKEETGLQVDAGEREIGRRVHPATGRTMIYLACRPVGRTDVHVGDPAELAEVRWARLAEVEQLLPGLYEPVWRHLVRELAGQQ